MSRHWKHSGEGRFIADGVVAQVSRGGNPRIGAYVRSNLYIVKPTSPEALAQALQEATASTPPERPTTSFIKGTSDQMNSHMLSNLRKRR
jgi:hypothetical protein